MTALQLRIDTFPKDPSAKHRPWNAPQSSGWSSQDEFLPSALRLLKAADSALHGNRMEVRRCIVELKNLLISTYAQDNAGAVVSAARGGLAPWQIQRVAEFISGHIAEAIRIQDLAAVARLSTGYFSHAFRCSTGQSPYAYVLRRRVQHAQELMLGTDAPLAEIALDCGFTDQPHFTRLFRGIVGVPPAAWRRQMCVGPSA